MNKRKLYDEMALIVRTFILKLFTIGKACINLGLEHYGSYVRFTFICVAPKTGSYYTLKKLQDLEDSCFGADLDPSYQT